MATTVGLTLSCCLLLLVSQVALGNVVRRLAETGQRGVEFGPRNVAVMQGSTTTLQCESDGVADANLRWFEIDITSIGENMISDGLSLIDSHPNRARYELSVRNSRAIDLVINNVNLGDAGFYMCRDSNAGPPNIVQLGAQLVVLETSPKCNKTYPDSGAVVEGQYHTIQCIQTFNSTKGIVPLMTWTGPEPFNYGYSFTDNVVWSGISFTADRSQSTMNWICKTNFTSTGFTGPDRDTNPPDYVALNPSNQVFVFWGPRNMTVYPIQASYEIGDTITCSADASPAPTYLWQSLRTSEQWLSQTFTTRADMVGYQLMRCTASNNILGLDYTRDIFQDVYVNPPPTSTTTTTPEPTTPVPAWADCSSLTGLWRSTNPPASLCITVNMVNNDARITGLYKNGSDPFWMNIFGKTRVDNYKTIGWAMVFPNNMIGVSAYAGECHSCYGTDQILAHAISRTTQSSQFCASGGVVNQSPQFNFFRAPPVYPCIGSALDIQKRIQLNGRGMMPADDE